MTEALIIDFIEDEFSARSRKENIERLKTEKFDLLIIGGGITGASTACEATSRGLKTALLEMKDFASGTSSKSSKLLHGGVRYLESFEFKLVFESLRDRNDLFKRIPHIARPMSFVAPVYKGYKETVMLMNLGLTLYDFLSFASRNMVTKLHKLFSRDKLAEFEPGLKKDQLKGAIQYFDGACDDARLTIENIKTASRLGAVVSNYTMITGFEKDSSGEAKAVLVKDLLSGESFAVYAEKILNAAGPWVDSVNKKENNGYKNRLKPTKGIHLIMPELTKGNAVLLKTHSPPHRWVFVIPYGEYSIVGTTDTQAKTSAEDDFDFLDDDNYANQQEIDYLLDTVNYYFPGKNYTDREIISSYGGWRPLIAPPEGKDLSESDISRDHEIFETESGVISVAGGKLTTYMSMARHIVDYLVKKTELKKFAKNSAVYPQLCSWQSAHENLDAYISQEAKKYPLERKPLIDQLIGKYGTEYKKIIEIIESSPDMEKEIIGLSPEATCLRAEVLYSVFFEMTETLQDFMCRRNRIILRDKHQGLEAMQEIAWLMVTALGDILDWSEEERQKWINTQIFDYQQEVERVNGFKKVA